MVRLHCQLGWIEKDLGHQQSICLGVSMRMFPGRVHYGRKTQDMTVSWWESLQTDHHKVTPLRIPHRLKQTWPRLNFSVTYVLSTA